MPYNTYNSNQDNRPTTNTYTPISFANSKSTIQASRFSISYFNQVMRVSIALKLESAPDQFARYDNANSVDIYLSHTKAKLLHDAVVDMFSGNSGKNNVCVETKNGLLKISNGIEFGSETPVISITYMDPKTNAVSEVKYQTSNNYTVAYNYSGQEYSSMMFPNYEIDTILMCFEEYYKASSYAIAASVRASNAYQQKFNNDMLKAIAGKVGVDTKGLYSGAGSSNISYASHSFLNSQNEQQKTPASDIPEGYDVASLADIMNNMPTLPSED